MLILSGSEGPGLPLSPGLESWLRAHENHPEISVGEAQGGGGRLCWKGNDPGTAGDHKSQPKSQGQSRGKRMA